MPNHGHYCCHLQTTTKSNQENFGKSKRNCKLNVKHLKILVWGKKNYKIFVVLIFNPMH